MVSYYLIILIVISNFKLYLFRDRLERLGKKRLGGRRRSVLASDKEDSASSAGSSRVPSPVRGQRPESPNPKSRLSTPNLKPTNSPTRSVPGSPSANRQSVKRIGGTVRAAKDALERRASNCQNLSSSPLPGKRFM
jgi:hypothetical protein